MSNRDEWGMRLIGVFIVLVVFVGFPAILYMAHKESKECKARGGVVVRDLGCIDLKKLRP